MYKKILQVNRNYRARNVPASEKDLAWSIFVILVEEVHKDECVVAD